MCWAGLSVSSGRDTSRWSRWVGWKPAYEFSRALTLVQRNQDSILYILMIAIILEYKAVMVQSLKQVRLKDV